MQRVIKVFCDVLTAIDLSHNRLDASEAKMLAGAVSDAGCSLTFLNLESNAIGNAGGQAIGEALRTNMSLTKCSLCKNGMKVVGWASIFKALWSNPNSKIASWDLSNDRVGAAIATPLATYISYSAGSLTSLALRNILLDGEGATAICEALRSHTGVRALDISNNRINARDGARNVGAAIGACRSLTSFAVGDNMFGDKGIAALMAGLQESKSLVTLDVSNVIFEATVFGAKGAKAVALAIPAMSSLSSVRIELALCPLCLPALFLVIGL